MDCLICQHSHTDLSLTLLIYIFYSCPLCPGAEAMVFARGADLSWLNAVKVVAMKVHPKLGKFFGTDVS